MDFDDISFGGFGGGRRRRGGGGDLSIEMFLLVLAAVFALWVWQVSLDEKCLERQCTTEGLIRKVVEGHCLCVGEE